MTNCVRNEAEDLLIEIANGFQIEAPSSAVEHLIRGNINDTFMVTIKGHESPTYILQKINRTVFQNVSGLMKNVSRVCSLLGAEHAVEGSKYRGLALVQTLQGEDYLEYNNEPWRMYHYINESESFLVCPSVDHASAAGKSAGWFEKKLSTLPAEEFTITIDRFQDIAFRYEQLDEALSNGDGRRIKEAASEIKFAEHLRTWAEAIQEKVSLGVLPQRVIHNDLKFNNVLFQRGESRAICIVDLDTCMPGPIHFDFGDFIRDASIPCPEDESNLDLIKVDLSLYEALTTSFLSELSEVLLPAELVTLPLAPRFVSLSLGVRFLADYLNGDRYFKVNSEKHNLIRTRAQFAGVRAFQNSEEAFERIISVANKR